MTEQARRKAPAEQARTASGPVAPPEPVQEAVLVERAKNGNLEAYDELVKRYQERIYATVYHMTSNHEDANDLAQDAFIKAFQALKSFKGGSSFYTWLYRIAVNTAKKALVDLKRDPLVSEASLAVQDEGDETSRVENELSDGETPEALLASREIAAAVNAAIEALSEDLRQAITLREIEGLSYEEIAEVMNCPIGTVRSRIFRAREAIAARLRPLLDTREGERW